MNRELRRRRGVGIADVCRALAVVLCCVAVAKGQGRDRVSLSSPGNFQEVGKGVSSTRNFTDYSSGLGALGNSSAPLGGGSVLSSSIGTGGANYLPTGRSSDPLAVPNSSGASALNQALTGRPGGIGLSPSSPTNRPISGSYSRSVGGSRILGDLPSVAPGVRSSTPPSLLVTTPLYTGINNPLVSRPAYSNFTDPLSFDKLTGLVPQDTSTTGNPLIGPLMPQTPTSPTVPMVLNDAGGSGIGSALAKSGPTAFGLARAFVLELEKASSSLLQQRGRPITSLVPKNDSLYRKYMAQGDRSFRQGNYREAYTNFQIANDLGNHDPESYVCLLHTEFALSAYSYAKACYFLEQAMRYMPELPLANLRPRGFYDNEAKYAQQLIALVDHIAKRPSDHEAVLLLAYFRWFEDKRDTDATRKLLAKALAAGLEKKDPLLIDAVETFWRGIVASGAATGELQPEPRKTP